MAAPSVEDYPFVALRDLEAHGSPAFRLGDRIPADHPKKFEWELGEDYAEIGSEAADEVVAGPQRPGKSASKGEWVAYVVALHDRGEPAGLSADAADVMTRDELVAHVDEHAG